MLLHCATVIVQLTRISPPAAKKRSARRLIAGYFEGLPGPEEHFGSQQLGCWLDGVLKSAEGADRR